MGDLVEALKKIGIFSVVVLTMITCAVLVCACGIGLASALSFDVGLNTSDSHLAVWVCAIVGAILGIVGGIATVADGAQGFTRHQLECKFKKYESRITALEDAAHAAREGGEG